MTDHPPIKTLDTVTFGPCGQDNHELFRVNPDIPLRQALEQVSAVHPRRTEWLEPHRLRTASPGSWPSS